MKLKVSITDKDKVVFGVEGELETFIDFVMESLEGYQSVRRIPEISSGGTIVTPPVKEPKPWTGSLADEYSGEEV